MEIKINSGDILPLEKALNMPNVVLLTSVINKITTIITTIFILKNFRIYFKKILYCDRIEISAGIDVNLIQDGPFWCCSQMRGAKRSPS